MSFAANIPTFEAFVRGEYLYDLKKGFGQFVPVLVFAVDSVDGRATGFDVITNFGAVFARLPICAITWKSGINECSLEELSLWNNFSYNIEAIVYNATANARICATLR